jgi:hypothetical protein
MTTARDLERLTVALELRKANQRIPTVRRFNDWPAAMKAAVAMTESSGRKHRVYQSPFLVYGTRWWIVERTYIVEGI